MRRVGNREFKSLFLTFVLLFQMFILPGKLQATVVVMVGQPNVWSLDQAHYLLAQIRERNLGLRNKSLDESDLDPNGINATRLDAYRSLFEAGVSFDQGLGVKNSMNRENLEFAQRRRLELFARRSSLLDEKANLLNESGNLNAELSRLEETDANEAAIKEKKREIKATNDKITAINQRIDILTAELNTVGSGSTDLSSPSPAPEPTPLGPMNERLAKTITDELAKSANQNSRLAATAKLDNYIQMQYELLAKQLTLLRDEVSPKDRLLFLELPTSIYATPGQDDDKSVQSWWKVAGYYRDNKYAKRRATLNAQIAVLHAKLVAERGAAANRIEQLRLQNVYDTQVQEINEEIAKAERDFYDEKAEALEQGLDYPFAYPDSTDLFLRPITTDNGRVIDLIPRQSSLNVNDLREVVKERGFKALFSLLIGIGGSINYQQRRDHFEQFQQQEVYAAGFGKGKNVFGWTFNPAPGTKRLTPGVRTTYAVVIVPREATRIVLQAAPHQFLNIETPLSDAPSLPALPLIPPPVPPPPPAAGAPATFTLEVPNGPNNEGFFVTRIDYHNVKVNTPSVVILRGNFSTQTGVLINGTPLTRTVGLASPFFGSERGSAAPALGAPDTTVKGHYEVINSNQMIMSFLMPVGFVGTPKITLISPNRARTLNDLNLNINGSGYGKLDDAVRVGSKPDDPKTPLSISDIQISPTVLPPGTTPRPTSAVTDVNLTLAGKKDGTNITIYFNATECLAAPAAPAAVAAPAPATCRLRKLADRLYNLHFDLPFSLEKISFTVIQEKELHTRELDNPIFLRALPGRMSYEIGDEEDPNDDVVTIVVEGKRIEDVVAVCNTADVQWQTQAFNQGILTVSHLSAGENTIRFTDGVTGLSLAPISIKRRPPKVKKPAKEN